MDEYKSKKNRKIKFWLYLFIIETITNLFTDGPANYTLTENEIKKDEKISLKMKGKI